MQDWKVGDRKFNAACVIDDETALVGDTVGQVSAFDLKMGRIKYKLKGCAGAITSISKHPTENLVAVGSRDRFVRTFDLKPKQGVKSKMKSKLYCKQALTACLFSSELPIVEEKKTVEAPVENEDAKAMGWDAELEDSDSEDISGDEADKSFGAQNAEAQSDDEDDSDDDDEDGSEEDSEEDSEDGATMAALMGDEEADEEDEDAESFDLEEISGSSDEDISEEDDDDEEVAPPVVTKDKKRSSADIVKSLHAMSKKAKVGKKK